MPDYISLQNQGAAGGDGCYVATCVYGSYDTPEVWTLRRFRDQFLGKSCLGRTFIRTYYKISPKLVARFGKTSWFCKGFKALLDRMVNLLWKRGYSSEPYKDVNWRISRKNQNKSAEKTKMKT